MPNPSSHLKAFIFSALPCEAKPLIDFFKLKKDISIQPFAVYTNKDICLTVTGIGKNAMAAGVAFTQALFLPHPNPILLNIGIAGHSNHPVGTLFLIDKISDSDSGRRFYPPLVFTPPCPTHSLQTSAKPQLAYPEQQLCDMEASAFYETATRFTTSELSHCLKIVSDNASSPVNTIKPDKVPSLIGSHLATIEVILTMLTEIADSLNIPTSTEFDQLLHQYRFTANEQIQLKKLISRWHLVTEKNIPEFITTAPKSGKEFIMLLNQSLNEAEFHL